MELMSSEPVVLTVKDRSGAIHVLEVPVDAELNLMEILKTFDFKMRATCGGMGLCADCHCKIIEGQMQLPNPTEQELETLDEIADAGQSSRLACQIIPGYHLHKIHLELLGVDYY